MVGRGEGKLVTETGGVGTAGAAQPSAWSGLGRVLNCLAQRDKLRIVPGLGIIAHDVTCEMCVPDANLHSFFLSSSPCSLCLAGRCPSLSS